ncbi:MAG: hypothetical protein ABL953_09940 [Ilumatobacteraceae bacterium]
MSLVLISATVFAGTALAFGGDDGRPGPGPRGFGRGRGDHHRAGGLLVVVLLVIATALITWFIARRRTAAVAPRSGNAEAILAERLARSEVSVEDYRTTLAALRETSSR